MSVCCDLQLAHNGGVAGHGLWREVVIAVRAVEEGLTPLAVAGHVGVQHQPRAGGHLRVQWTATA